MFSLSRSLSHLYNRFFQLHRYLSINNVFFNNHLSKNDHRFHRCVHYNSQTALVSLITSARKLYTIYLHPQVDCFLKKKSCETLCYTHTILYFRLFPRHRSTTCTHDPSDMMDTRRMSNWNVLSLEAALQQLNGPQDGLEVEKLVRKSNTVS